MEPATNPLFKTIEKPFPVESIPQPICDSEPGLVKLAEIAWRQAWDHVVETRALPNSPYLNEGCRVNRIWVWDSCLMSIFSRYSSEFPTEQTLDNFYDVMEGRSQPGILVHHPDNPPLFAWSELMLYRISGCLDRVDRLINRNRSLERHYDWMETGDTGQLYSWGAMPRFVKRLPLGYMWDGLPSGMDNTPRGNGRYNYIMWLDLLAQMGLAAKSIASLAESVGNSECAERFHREYISKKALMEEYWDNESGIYYDRSISHEKRFCRVLTPASFWPFLAEMGTSEQMELAIKVLLDDQLLGGIVPCPSVSRSDPAFNPAGEYWRGGVWLPTVYIVLKALEKYGKFELARQLSIKLLRHMLRTYEEYEPHTIWECYNPVQPLPSTNGKGRRCRADFCGWSALGPISILLENIIGIWDVDAVVRRIRWNCQENIRSGVRNLRLGNESVSLMFKDGKLQVECDSPFILEWNRREFNCPAGCTTFDTTQ